MGDGGRCDGAGVTSAGGAELVERVTMWRYDRTALPSSPPTPGYRKSRRGLCGDRRSTGPQVLAR